MANDQKIIFDLGNSISSTNTASYHVILSATYFMGPQTNAPADLILPISKRLANKNLPSLFSFPSENASDSILLPMNIRKAVLTIAATGQDTEEVSIVSTESNLIS